MFQTSIARAQGLRALVPGLGVIAAITVTATLLSLVLASVGVTWLSAVFIAIVLGLAVRTGVGFRPSWRPGTDFTTLRLLRAGIVLLGVQFSLGQVATSGVNALLAVVIIIVVSGLTVWTMWRLTRTGWRLSFLIGIGTAICGNSAIVAAAPVIKAREEEVSYASFTITAFGMLAMVAYPLVGYGLGFDDAQYGMLAGAGIHDSAQSIASGFIYSDGAGAEAAIVKLTRVAFLAPLILLTAWALTRRERAAAPTSGLGAAPAQARRAVPWFALGFVALAAVRSAGDLAFGGASAWLASVEVVREVALGLITAAMAVVGLSTRLDTLRRIGPRPFFIGLTSSLVVGGIALGFALAR